MYACSVEKTTLKMPTVSANDDAYRHLGVMSLEPLTAETWNGATVVPKSALHKKYIFLHTSRISLSGSYLSIPYRPQELIIRSIYIISNPNHIQNRETLLLEVFCQSPDDLTRMRRSVDRRYWRQIHHSKEGQQRSEKKRSQFPLWK